MNLNKNNNSHDFSTSLKKSDKPILITGASGFLGQHLVKHLAAQGRKIKALYFKTPPNESLKNLPGVKWISCDLLDIFQVEEVMKGIDEIFHCAAIVSFHPGAKEKMIHFNVQSTINLVNEALSQDIRKMVYVSSIAALGRSEERKEITEEAQWEESRNNSKYSWSKYLAEMEVWRGIGEGLNAVILNPGIILGEGDWGKGSSALLKVAHQEFPFYTNGVNSFVDVQDVVTIMIRLMESDIHSERFILSAGNFSYKEIFTEMALALDKRPPYIKAGKLLTGMVWRWKMLASKFSGGPATITKETAHTSQKQIFYNNKKLLDFLPGFTYRDIKSTIHRMAKVFKEGMTEKN